MGTNNFKAAGGVPHFGQQGTNLEARAIGSNTFGGRAAAKDSSKDLAAAMAINKAGAYKKNTRGSAYAPGPKRT